MCSISSLCIKRKVGFSFFPSPLLKFHKWKIEHCQRNCAQQIWDVHVLNISTAKLWKTTSEENLIN